MPSSKSSDSFTDYQKDKNSNQIFRFFICFLKKKSFSLAKNNQLETTHFEVLR